MLLRLVKMSLCRQSFSTVWYQPQAEGIRQCVIFSEAAVCDYPRHTVTSVYVKTDLLSNFSQSPDRASRQQPLKLHLLICCKFVQLS